MKYQVESWIEPLIDRLWEIRAQIIKDEEDNKEHLGDYFGFRFGDGNYADLPKKVYSKIPRPIIKLVQLHTYYLLTISSSKKMFAKKFLKLAASDTIKIV